jgi:glucose/arabinose dehydrogenase
MLRRTFLLASAAAVCAVSASALIAVPVTAQSPVFKSSVHDYRLVTVAEGLVQPWSMAFLPGGDLLVTERPGRLRIVRGGKLLPTPVTGVPEVVYRGQGGLLDVVAHPNFATNKLIYLSFSKPVGSGAATTAVVRGRFEKNALVDVKEIFVADTKGAPGHYGSRIAFDKSGMLFIAVGDRQVSPSGDLEKHPSQDVSNHHGKVVRLFDDGRVPTDNPFVGKSGAKPEIWSYGHRNPQGLAIHPTTGDVWETEHGPQGGDELNLIQKGLNYGWPVVGFGVNYGPGVAIHAGTMRPGMEQPKNVWVPSIATSSLMIYTGDKFPAWKGSFFVGGLTGQRITRLTYDGKAFNVEDNLVRNQGRIRDVRQGLDGFIYFSIDDQQQKPTAVMRMEPVARR